MSIVSDKEWYELPFPSCRRKARRDSRNELRAEEPARHRGAAARDARHAGARRTRTPTRTNDGTYNDLRCPRMGSAGVRFGRNVPLSETFPDTANLMNPNPRTVSLELLTRTTFQPATIVNVLAAAWIQFQVHDWFMHKKGVWTHTHDIPLADGDAWHERPDARARDAGRSAEGAELDASAGLHQRELALVGRLAGLRLAPPPQQAALRTGRDGKVLVGAERPARLRCRHRPRDHRLHRELVGRPEPAARPVRARAQRDLRHAAHAQPELGRRAAVPAGAAGQRRADGEDSHRRVDTGDPAEPDHQAGAAHELARRSSATCRRCSPASTTTSCSAAFPARRPIITRRRTRSPRSSCPSTGCTR